MAGDSLQGSFPHRTSIAPIAGRLPWKKVDADVVRGPSSNRIRLASTNGDVGRSHNAGTEIT